MSHIPFYVYPLFAALLWLGVTRCFPRTIRVERLIITPVLIAALGIQGFSGLFPAAGALDLAASLLGLLAGLLAGYHHGRRWAVRVDKGARLITVPGDPMLLVIILATFFFEFVLHYGVESGAAWAAGEPTRHIAAAIWGLFAGMSAGRNLALARQYLDARRPLRPDRGLPSPPPRSTG